MRTNLEFSSFSRAYTVYAGMGGGGGAKLMYTLKINGYDALRF